MFCSFRRRRRRAQLAWLFGVGIDQVRSADADDFGCSAGAGFAAVVFADPRDLLPHERHNCGLAAVQIERLRAAEREEQLRQLVEQGYVSGWDDPRMPPSANAAK